MIPILQQLIYFIFHFFARFLNEKNKHYESANQKRRLIRDANRISAHRTAHHTAQHTAHGVSLQLKIV